MGKSAGSCNALELGGAIEAFNVDNHVLFNLQYQPPPPPFVPQSQAKNFSAFGRGKGTRGSRGVETNALFPGASWVMNKTGIDSREYERR
jgi:hypothetical protein